MMSGKTSRLRHKWSLDFSSRNRGDRQLETLAQLPAPCGFTDKQLSEKGNSADINKPDLVVKKSWDIALGPLKQVPMNLFIMWMAGNSISIFPIMMVGMMFVRPFQALFAVNQTFKLIEGGQSHLQKFVYIIGNLTSLGLAVYKCQVMGLLPTHASDWLAFVEPQERLEWTGGGMIL